MKIDNFGSLVSEACDFPGNIGDSCAETSRYFLLMELGLGLDPGVKPLQAVTVSEFRTTTGYVRHPNAPDGPPVSLTSWRESDFSADQATPLLMSYDVQSYPSAQEMRSRLKSTLTTGNGNLIPPGLAAIVFELRTILAITLLFQSFIFLIPYRWNDSIKWFEKSDSSSADYLNWFSCLTYLHLLGERTLVGVVRTTVSKDILTSKIKSYYAPEPNSDWLLATYALAIASVYK